MENTDRTGVDYTSHPEWLWPAHKFGLDPDDQFTTLHERFNTWGIPLQNAHAFHADLADLAHTHTTRKTIYSTTLNDADNYDDRWANFTQLSRTRALDAFIAFLCTFLPEHENRLMDADISKRTQAETRSRRAAADTPRERVNLTNKDGDFGENVTDIASIPSTASCFNGIEVDVDKGRTSVSPLPKYISTEGTAPPISYKVPQSDIVLGPECPTRSSRLRQSSNRNRSSISIDESAGGADEMQLESGILSDISLVRDAPLALLHSIKPSPQLSDPAWTLPSVPTLPWAEDIIAASWKCKKKQQAGEVGDPTKSDTATLRRAEEPDEISTTTKEAHSPRVDRTLDLAA
ncbi:hypothetical protein PG993_006980 [Apiospora rasikravindrae]|uniref:Uncharacterized protein n=1 Tax=Apiospora rasikravindrae TaxID=990691 RepID=A0ABR1SXZ5_9PEZI